MKCRLCPARFIMKQKNGISFIGALILMISAMVMVFGCSKSEGGKPSAKSLAKLLESLNTSETTAIVEALKTASVSDLLNLTKTSASPGGDFFYDLNKDGNGIIIKGYTGSATTLIIPNTIENYSVTEIGEHAFELKKSKLLSFRQRCKFWAREPFISLKLLLL